MPNDPPALGIDLNGMAANLVPVTLGNLVGGAVLVAGVYWIVWRKATPVPPSPRKPGNHAS